MLVNLLSLPLPNNQPHNTHSTECKTVNHTTQAALHACPRSQMQNAWQRTAGDTKHYTDYYSLLQAAARYAAVAQPKGQRAGRHKSQSTFKGEPQCFWKDGQTWNQQQMHLLHLSRHPTHHHNQQGVDCKHKDTTVPSTRTFRKDTLPSHATLAAATGLL
jgi:hypothetical protein